MGFEHIVLLHKETQTEVESKEAVPNTSTQTREEQIKPITEPENPRNTITSPNNNYEISSEPTGLQDTILEVTASKNADLRDTSLELTSLCFPMPEHTTSTETSTDEQTKQSNIQSQITGTASDLQSVITPENFKSIDLPGYCNLSIERIPGIELGGMSRLEKNANTEQDGKTGVKLADKVTNVVDNKESTHHCSIKPKETTSVKTNINTEPDFRAVANTDPNETTRVKTVDDGNQPDEVAAENPPENSSAVEEALTSNSALTKTRMVTSADGTKLLCFLSNLYVCNPSHRRPEELFRRNHATPILEVSVEVKPAFDDNSETTRESNPVWITRRDEECIIAFMESRGYPFHCRTKKRFYFGVRSRNWQTVFTEIREGLQNDLHHVCFGMFFSRVVESRVINSPDDLVISFANASQNYSALRFCLCLVDYTWTPDQLQAWQMKKLFLKVFILLCFFCSGNRKFLF